MPGRPLLFDLRCRNETICRSCLLSIRQRVAPQSQPWVAAYSSQAGRTRPRRRAAQAQPSRPPATRKPLQADLIQQLEQLKAWQQQPGGPAQAGTDFNVNFYEEENGKRTKLEDDGSFEQGLGGLDATGLKQTLDQMKGALGTEEERLAFEEVMSQMSGGWDRLRTVDDIENMLSNADEYTASLDAEIQKTAAELPEELQDTLYERFGELMPRPKDRAPGPRQTAVPRIPESPWSANQLKKITRLNATVHRISWEMRSPKGLTQKHVTAVYKSYHAARRCLAHSWSSVPVDFWDFLWRVFSADEKINKHRLTHISLLGRDMSEAKVTLSPTQQLLTIEAVFNEGWEARAVDNWKRCMSTLGGEDLETFQSFWELGVRMHCRTGDLEQADRAANILLNKQSDPRILLPIIQARAEQDSPEEQENTWRTYRKMRELLGQNMKLKDYDQVVSCFLSTNQTENALYTFVDMMSDGQIDLKKLKYMPTIVANKFFVGKWLKRLIGAGDLDGAHSVIDFMRKKGVQVSAIHVNGLIGAWQRSGGADNMDKADALAWEMINSRTDFVKTRRNPPGTRPVQPKSGIAPVPRATLETFCVIAENYRVRELNDKMARLWDAFREAEISPDAFMMNQLLESHIQAGEHKQATSMYTTLVTERGVKPDPHTFSALWKTLGINRLHHVEGHTLGLEADAARRMFAETAKFKDVFQPGGMDIQLSRKILHTFRRLKDNGGFLVALTSLKELFSFLPPEMLALEMVIGTTKLSTETPQQRRRMVSAKRDLDRDLIEWAGGDLSKLQGGKRGVALCEYLQKKFWPQTEGGEGLEKVLAEVAKQMGVYEVLVPKRKGNNKP